MKQHSTKQKDCTALNFKNNIAILNRVVIFFLFISVGATAHTTYGISAPGKITSVNSPGCVAGFTDSTSNLAAYFTSTSTDTNANTEYRWQFGDGGISHQKNPTHLYSASGSFTICLTIINSGLNCSDSVCHTVTITQCQAAFDTSVNGNTVTVTSTSTGVDANTTYTWNFGDGTIGHQASQSHTYNPPPKICDVPVTLANSIDTASSAGLQVMVTVNSSTYSAKENAGLQNVEFTTGPDGTGTPLQAWIESGNSSSSTSTVYWVNLGSNIIPANGTLTIYMNFMTSNIMSASGPTGEAPQLSATYGQYDNGSLVFPNVYTAWGGLSNGSVPSGISIIGSPYITNYTNYTAYVLNPNDCCTPDVLYYTNTPASAQGTTVMETYCSMDGAYMWWGTNDGQGDGDAPGIIVSWDAGCIYQDYGMKDGGNCYDLLTPVSTTPYIWTIELANNNYVTAIDNDYTQVLGPQATDQSVANPPYFGYFGTTQNDGYGGNDEADIYWTRTRIYPPGGVLPGVSFGLLACETGNNTYDVCLTISNPITGCSSQSCDSVSTTAFVSSCQASFDTSVTGNQLTVTSTSTGVDASTTYTWNFGDGGTGHQQSETHTYPSSARICSVPVTLTNSMNTASTAGLQVMVTVNSSQYSANESGGLQNVEFTTGNNGTGTVLQAWIESGASNSSTNTIYWVNLGNTIISANGALTIYMNFMPSSVMSPSGPTGEASMLSSTYGQYDNGSMVFPNVYTAWGGLSNGSVPNGISIIGSPYITNHTDYTAYVLNPNDCCTPDVLYYTNTPASAQGTTVMETYCSMDGAYMWWGTNDGQGDGDAPGIIVSWDAGCIDPDYSMKDGGNCYDLLTPVSTTPYIWTIELANNNYVTAIDNNYTQVLGPQPTDQSVANPPYFGYFGTTQNDGYGGNDEADIYWTRTRIYPPGGVLPAVSFGPLTCQTVVKYDVCLTISNPSTQCYSTTCDTVSFPVFISTCQAAFSSATNDLTATFTNSSTGTNANTIYNWSFGDGGVSHQPNAVHHYGSPGNYTACLTIQNIATGCFDSVCHDLTITQCQASFTDSINNNTIMVTSTSTGTDSNTVYDWSFGDGSVGHQPSQSHIYAPSSTTICGIPVTLTNNQNTPTPTGFQQMITINSSLYTSNESAGLENVEFTTGAEGEGAVLQAWAESGATNSSTSTVWWVNLGSATIPANGTLIIYMNFMPANVMSPIGPTGEAPQLSGTYAQYDNGALVFPGAYTAWGGLTGGNVPAAISTIGSPGVTNNATYTELNYQNCCSAVGAYYTSTPSSASNYPTVLESYTSMQGYYMWYGTGNGEEESGTGVVICYDYPGFSNTYFGIKSDNQNYQDLTSATLTNNPVIWSILIQDTVTLNSVLENYNQVLGSETIYATNPQYYGFFGTYQNGGSDLCDIYWTRTRTYPPGGIMPGSSVGTMTCAQRGIYTVCLNISNTATGCNSSSCQNVVVGSLTPCQAGFKDSSSNTFAFFTDTSGGTDTNTTYRWNFGDGGVSHVANPTHNYSSSGTYTVCLTIQNSATGCLDSVCHSVTISQCLASFDTSVTNLVLTLTSTSIGVGVNTTYNWTFGDGDTSHRQSPSHKYKTFGTYNVCLTITDTVSGCTSAACEKVKIGKPASVCGADFTSSTSGDGLTVNFTNTSTDTTAATQYTWSFGDNSFSHLRNPQHSYNSAGKYDVCLTITDSTESFCDSTFCDSITLIKLPDVCGADFTYSSSGFTANFTSTSMDTTTATQYRWTFGDDSISHQRNPKHNYKKAGTYTVCLTITDSTLSYCDSTLCEDVTITNPTSECTANFTWTDVNGQGIHFYSTSQDTTTNTQYVWTLGDGTTLKNEVDPSHRYAKGGTYYVCLTITDSTETYCNSTFCDSVTFVPTGINQLSVNSNQLSVYPNPNSGEFTISSTENMDEISVTDLLGRVIYKSPSEDLEVTRQTIDLSSSPDGIYFLAVKAGGESVVYKIVVSR